MPVKSVQRTDLSAERRELKRAAGTAEFTFGGTATGMHDTGPGEKCGGTITGGTVVTIKPGDFLVVPAGQPHLTQVKPGSNFRAIVFKVRA